MFTHTLTHRDIHSQRHPHPHTHTRRRAQTGGDPQAVGPCASFIRSWLLRGWRRSQGRRHRADGGGGAAGCGGRWGRRGKVREPRLREGRDPPGVGWKKDETGQVSWSSGRSHVGRPVPPAGWRYERHSRFSLLGSRQLLEGPWEPAMDVWGAGEAAAALRGRQPGGGGRRRDGRTWGLRWSALGRARWGTRGKGGCSPAPGHRTHAHRFCP